MTNQTENKEPQRTRGQFYETTRAILMAGIGAFSLAQEEMNNFVNRLVERGELAEADARNLVREVMERREKLERERRQQSVEGRQQAAATRTDIEALNARIAELTRQIEELRNERQS
jgi:polyhydroxyalkanoate synthesis regulator phasin